MPQMTRVHFCEFTEGPYTRRERRVKWFGCPGLPAGTVQPIPRPPRGNGFVRLIEGGAFVPDSCFPWLCSDRSWHPQSSRAPDRTRHRRKISLLCFVEDCFEPLHRVWLKCCPQ